MHIISKTVAAYELGNNSEWIQTFCDGASRSASALTMFSVETLNDNMETAQLF